MFGETLFFVGFVCFLYVIMFGIKIPKIFKVKKLKAITIKNRKGFFLKKNGNQKLKKKTIFPLNFNTENSMQKCSETRKLGAENRLSAQC